MSMRPSLDAKAAHRNTVYASLKRVRYATLDHLKHEVWNVDWDRMMTTELMYNMIYNEQHKRELKKMQL